MPLCAGIAKTQVVFLSALQELSCMPLTRLHCSVAMLLPLMLLLAAAGVSAQPVTINDLTCPTNNVETLEPNTNLNEHKTPGSTYLLKPGTYYIRDEIYLGDGEALCYVGTGNSREGVVVSLTGIDLSYTPFLLQKRQPWPEKPGGRWQWRYW